MAAMIISLNSKSVSFDRVGGRVIVAYNPRTSQYSLAILSKRKKPTDSNKAKAEETLGRLGSLFGEDK